MGDEVGRVVDLSAEAANDVAVRLAERVRDALVRIGAEPAGECRRRLEPRGRQLDRVQRQRLLDLVAAEAEASANLVGGRRQSAAGELRALEPPAPVLAAAGYQWTPRIR
jgi:hypothetical protein